MPQPAAVMSILLCPQDLRFEKPWHVSTGSRSVPFPPPPSQSFPPQSFPPIQFLGAPESVHSLVPSPRCCYTRYPWNTPRNTFKTSPGHQHSSLNPILQLWKLRQGKPSNPLIATYLVRGTTGDLSPSFFFFNLFIN